jgi:hypothetical protein
MTGRSSRACFQDFHGLSQDPQRDVEIPLRGHDTCVAQQALNLAQRHHPFIQTGPAFVTMVVPLGGPHPSACAGRFPRSLQQRVLHQSDQPFCCRPSRTSR